MILSTQRRLRYGYWAMILAVYYRLLRKFYCICDWPPDMNESNDIIVLAGLENKWGLVPLGWKSLNPRGQQIIGMSRASGVKSENLDNGKALWDICMSLWWYWTCSPRFLWDPICYWYDQNVRAVQFSLLARILFFRAVRPYYESAILSDGQVYIISVLGWMGWHKGGNLH